MYYAWLITIIANLTTIHNVWASSTRLHSDSFLSFHCHTTWQPWLLKVKHRDQSQSPKHLTVGVPCDIHLTSFGLHHRVLPTGWKVFVLQKETETLNRFRLRNFTLSGKKIKVSHNIWSSNCIKNALKAFNTRNAKQSTTRLYKSNVSNRKQWLGTDQSAKAIEASDTLPPIPTEEREAGSGVNQGSMWEIRKENA